VRVLYIVQHFSGPSGTGSSRAYEHARRLVVAGHSVTLLCGRTDRGSDSDESEARAAGIDVRRAPTVYAQGMSYTRRLVVFGQYMRWAVREGRSIDRPDVVLASSTPLTVGEIGRQVARHHNVPFVFEVRDLWPEVANSLGALRTPILRWMAHRMARRVYLAADRVIALSLDMAGVIATWGVDAARITVVPNASDVDLFGTPETQEQRADMRSRLGWSDLFVALHAGAMGRANGLEYLLEAGAWLDRQGERGVRIALLGDGALRSRLAERIMVQGIRSVEIHPPVSRLEVPGWFAAADVAVSTVLDRPFLAMNSANKFFDALASGRPVLLNYAGWQTDLVREAGAGLTVDSRDPSSLARSLLALRDDPARCASMARAARSLAEERFDRIKLARDVENVLASAVLDASVARSGR